jgi:hypothetical protein
MTISSASAVNDQFVAGKNKIINGDLRYNQRNFTSITQSGGFWGFDRFIVQASTSATMTAQTFTPGTAPVSGYEGINYVQVTSASQSATTDYTQIATKIEDVRTLAGQTWTYSFWAKASTGTPQLTITLEQCFGTGGTPSANVQTPFGNVTLSTSWQRYSVTGVIPSIAGKTLGTNNDHFTQTDTFLSLGSNYSGYGTLGVQNITVSFWGFQLEAGTVATAFTTASGSIAGELALCQRYYNKIIGDPTTLNSYQMFCVTMVESATTAWGPIYLPVKMRAAPSVTFGGTSSWSFGGTLISVASLLYDTNQSNSHVIVIGTGSASGWTTFQSRYIRSNGDASASINCSAEL